MRHLSVIVAAAIAAAPALALAQHSPSEASTAASVVGSGVLAFSPIMLVGVVGSEVIHFSEALSIVKVHPDWTVEEVTQAATGNGQAQVLAKIKSADGAATLIIPVAKRESDKVALTAGDRIQADAAKRTVVFTKGNQVIAAIADPAVSKRATVRKD